jgi:CBS-domain-containing membrane protein
MRDNPTCGAIMTPPPAVIAPTDTVAAALAVILKYRTLGAPVADDAGVYRGMFLRSLLIRRLLPGIAVLEDDFSNITRIINAATAGETLANLHQRYVAIANDRVEQHMDTKTPPVRPDTPLIETVHQLHLRRSMLPVVDATTKKLLGVVSTWDLLKKISADT